MLELRNHRCRPQYFSFKFSPSSSSCSYSCSCSCPMFRHRIPVFSLPVHTAFLCSDPYSDMFLFLMAMLSDLYIDPHLVLYSICSNIDFDYCSHCLLDLWSLLTSIQLL